MHRLCLQTPMPTAVIQKKPANADWHPAKIKAEVEQAGWSLRQLGFHHGYQGDSSLSEVFRRPWPKVEKIIAETIGQRPEVIWPSRYDGSGQPNRLRGRAPRRPAHINSPKAITPKVGRNPQSKVGK